MHVGVCEGMSVKMFFHARLCAGGRVYARMQAV